MAGFWMSRARSSPGKSRKRNDKVGQLRPESQTAVQKQGTKTGNWGGVRLRGSDLTERRYACMQALIEVAGMNVQEAACEVASALGSNTSKSVETIRLGYYDFRRMLEEKGAELFSGDLGPLLSGFHARRDWVLYSDQDAIDFAVELYCKKFGKIRAERLAESFKKMRKDPTQIKANQSWLERQLSGLQRALEMEPHVPLEVSVAYLGECARLLRRLNRRADALVLLRQALSLCQTPGAVFPRQDKVAAVIQSEIDRNSST